jgi:hypothetical protein
MRTLTAVENAALIKAAGKAPDLGDGTNHTVDFFVHVRGTMKQGEGYEQSQPASANLQALLLVALSKLNGTTAEFVASLVTEAEQLDAEALKAETAKVKEYADDAMAKIKAATISRCKGKLTGKVSAVVVPADAVSKDRMFEMAAA